MSFGGPPVTVETIEEADELTRNFEKESAIGKYVATPILHDLSPILIFCYIVIFLLITLDLNDSSLKCLNVYAVL